MNLKGPSFLQLGQIVILVGLFGQSDFFSFGAIILTVAIGLPKTIVFIGAGLQLLAIRQGIEIKSKYKEGLYNIFHADFSYWITTSLGVLIVMSAIYHQWIFTAAVWAYIILLDEVYRRVVYRTVPPPNGYPHGVETPR